MSSNSTPFSPQLAPLVDDGEDEEAEDEDRDPQLQGDSQRPAAGRPAADPGTQLPEAVQKWLTALHVALTLW